MGDPSATGRSTRILVLSLDTAVDRQAVFARSAPEGVDWSFFDAWRTLHPELDYDEQRAQINFGRVLTRGEIGCYSSHYAMWTALIEDEQTDRYIILEDDVIVDWEFIARLSRTGDLGHDYIRLYYKRPVASRKLVAEFIERTKALVEVHGYAFGTQGYVISKAGARRFRDACRRVDRPIDNAMDRSWVHGIPNLAIFPFPLIESFTESEIGGKRFERHPVPSALHGRWRRAQIAEKLRYQLGRLRFFFRSPA